MGRSMVVIYRIAKVLCVFVLRCEGAFRYLRRGHGSVGACLGEVSRSEMWS